MFTISDGPLNLSSKWCHLELIWTNFHFFVFLTFFFFYILKALLKKWDCQKLAGLLQQQQMVRRATGLGDRARIMVELVRKAKYSKFEILDRCYVIAGIVPASDGTKVSSHFYLFCYFKWYDVSSKLII